MCLTRTAPRFAERRIQQKPFRTFSVRLRTQAQAQTSKRRVYGRRARRRCVWPFSDAPKVHSFLHQSVRDASGGPFFSVLPEKNGEKRGTGERNSADAPEKQIVPLCVLSLHRPSSKRPSGGLREALIKSAAVDGERFFVKTRLEKRGNTVCISRFSNRRIGGKDPSSAVGDLFRGSLESGFPSARYTVQVVSFAPVEYLTYGSRNRRRVFR